MLTLDDAKHTRHFRGFILKLPRHFANLLGTQRSVYLDVADLI